MKPPATSTWRHRALKRIMRDMSIVEHVIGEAALFIFL